MHVKYSTGALSAKKKSLAFWRDRQGRPKIHDNPKDIVQPKQP